MNFHQMVLEMENNDIEVIVKHVGKIYIKKILKNILIGL